MYESDDAFIVILQLIFNLPHIKEEIAKRGKRMSSFVLGFQDSNFALTKGISPLSRYQRFFLYHHCTKS